MASADPARPPSAETAPPLRVGVIGTGGISRAHAPGWIRAGAEIHTGANIHAYSHSGVEKFSQQFGATAHGSLDELLAAVDVVDICTPTPAHSEQIHLALDAGKHVVCEKPMTLSPADAQAAVEHAERAGRMLFPAHVVRYFPQYAAAKTAIDAGRLGRPAVLRFERTGSFPTQPWFADESQSGGIVMDQMIHDIDQAVWMAGPVTSVFARQHSAPSTDRIRTGHVVLTHAAGVISHCRGLWGAPGTRFRYAFSLAGDGGRLDYDSAKNTGIEFDEVAAATQSAGDGFLPSVTTFDDPYVTEILDVAGALRDGTDTRVTGADGQYAVALATAALESIATGRSVPC